MEEGRKHYQGNALNQMCESLSKQEKWLRLEKEIVKWVLSERQCGRIVTRALIRLKALQWAAKNKEDSMDFKGILYFKFDVLFFENIRN